TSTSIHELPCFAPTIRSPGCLQRSTRLLSGCDYASVVQPPHLIFKSKKGRKTRRVSDLGATRHPAQTRRAGGKREACRGVVSAHRAARAGSANRRGVAVQAGRNRQATRPPKFDS